MNTAFGAAFILSACLWSSLGGTLVGGGLISQLGTSLGDGLTELSENLATNWSELLEKLQPTLSE